MFQWIVVIATFFGSLIFANLIRPRNRLVIMPIAFAFDLLALSVLPSIGGVFHALYIFGKFVIWMLLLNGMPRIDLSNNPSWKSFLIFYSYMYVAGFFGLYVLEMSAQYINILLTAFGVGYFLSSWCCRTEGSVQKLLVATTLACVVVVVHQYFLGGFSASTLDDSGRQMLLDEATGKLATSTGVNGLALIMDVLLPFSLLAGLSPMNIRCPAWIRIAGMASFILIGLVIVRTGSRNGAFGLVPCFIYFLSSTRNANAKARRLFIGVVAGMIIVFGSLFMMRNVGYIRAFDIMANEQMGYASRGDVMTSGRLSLYERLFKEMSPLQVVVGAGYNTADAATFVSKNVAEGDREYMLAHRTRVGPGNMHSMYMTVFFRSGVVGSLLFFAFILKTIKEARRMGGRGRLALMFLSIWLLTGLGESAGMTSGSTSILAGFAMGLLGRKQIRNPELWDEPLIVSNYITWHLK